MTITIMGASGRVGGTVLETVAQAGRQVRALCRNPPADAARDGVEWRAVDALGKAIELLHPSGDAKNSEPDPAAAPTPDPAPTKKQR